MHCVYLSLGTNMGWRKHNLLRAIRLIDERLGRVSKLSDIHETAPWGYTSRRKFLNMCLELQTTLTPEQLLEGCEQIEREMGRTQKSANGAYCDRLIDIDILLFDQLSVQTQRLSIPHPHMREREFVMIPLREILPDI